MAAHGEVVLRQRVCRGSGCGAVFWICRHCDRGQRYCSAVCRDQARRGQLRRANCRYQQSPEGRLDHCDRQREYRRRKACVTDQGSLSITSPPSFGCGTPETTSLIRGDDPVIVLVQSWWSERPPTPMFCCIVCRRSSRFVDPFPRYPRFEREYR